MAVRAYVCMHTVYASMPATKTKLIRTLARWVSHFSSPLPLLAYLEGGEAVYIGYTIFYIRVNNHHNIAYMSTVAHACSASCSWRSAARMFHHTAHKYISHP